jgi:hypothetical protein
MEAPRLIRDWRETLRKRFAKRNRELGLPLERVHEFFTVTAWGTVPGEQQIINDFPNINRACSRLDEMSGRLKRWRGED